MKIWVIFTIMICRTARWLLRKLGKGGTNVPGTIALKMCPPVLKYLSRDVDIVIVTGTNGKTTITRIIEQCFTEAGLEFFTNKSGANMDTGIAAEFVVNSSLFGKCKYKYALIECDELALKNVTKYANVKYIIVSNIFRDQLDRYGEITHTVTGIYNGIKNVPNATVILNADCSLSTSLRDRIENKVIFYGLECPAYYNKVREVSDAPYCIKCGTEYNYEYVTYGHLGKYRCPKCGYARPDTQVCVNKIIETTADITRVELKIGENVYETEVNLPGGYNVYNGTAAAAVGYAMGIDDSAILRALKSFACGFGRMEKYSINGTDIRMILVKNPAGANQVLNFLSNITEPSLFVVGLNDRYADGTDVSWIWDADFERLAAMEEKLSHVVVTGIRADDMLLRLKYAGLPLSKLSIIRDSGEVLKYVVNQEKPAFIMPTYTEMLELRERFTKDYKIKEYWK